MEGNANKSCQLSAICLLIITWQLQTAFQGYFNNLLIWYKDFKTGV